MTVPFLGSIYSIRFVNDDAVALLYNGIRMSMTERAGWGIVGMAEWDGLVLHKSAAGTVYLRWPNDYLGVMFS